MNLRLHLHPVMLTVVGACLVIALPALRLTWSSEKNSPIGEYRLIDERGNSIASMFEGLPHLPADTVALKATRRCDSDPVTGSLITSVKNIFTLKSVHAQVNCQVTGCAGHYFLNEYYDCPPACEGPLYPSAYSDPEGPYENGYHQDGMNGCPLSACAFCRTVVCSNP